MPSIAVQIVFALMMVVVTITGFYCAARMSKRNPWWVRGVVLFPAMSALCALATMTRGHYVAYTQDIILAFGLMMLYVLVATRFSSRPWLDIRVKDAC
jgi:CDP-diglyceride synthetase